MDKDNSQEPMITSNSPSLEKGREKVYYSSNPAFYGHRLYHFRFLRRGNQPVIVKEKLRAGNG